MSNEYNAAAIEVLSGLEPVRKRPGMYTDTTRPNHLVQEVVDNSVDEAMAGFAKTIDVVLYKDGSVLVKDDGRGMPVDMHPEQGMTGVEVILTQLHSGGKFSNKNYQFSGGLHGVGVSVVNALSATLNIEVKRNGKLYSMDFADGEKQTELTEIGTVGKNNTGTAVKFLPNGKYFDSANISVSKLKHVLRAKAVLCPRLKISLTVEQTDENYEWYYQDGLKGYLLDRIGDIDCCPEQPFMGNMATTHEAVEWGIVWQWKIRLKYSMKVMSISCLLRKVVHTSMAYAQDSPRRCVSFAIFVIFCRVALKSLQKMSGKTVILCYQ